MRGSAETHGAVTGMGAVTAFGFGLARFWAGLKAGETTISSLAGRGLFDVSDHRTDIASVVEMGPDRSLGRADRFARAAAEEAVTTAFGGIEFLPRRAGVFFGSSTGALLETEQVFDRLLDGDSPLPLRQLGSQQHNGPGDTVARHLRIEGPVVSASAACASSTMAIGAALAALRTGEVDVAIAGGADELSQLTYAGFNSLRAVDERPTRPFRRDREGLSLGEGSGVLVLERAEDARARGATVYAHVAGAASTCDAHHMSAPLGDGSGAARAMRLAIADAGLQSEDIDFLNVHGTGTPQNDAAEWQAIQSVFGARAGDIPITATKALVGHLLGASGAIEAVATALCLHHELLHHVPAGGPVDTELPVRLVLEAPLRVEGVRAALSTNLAFGGANSSVAMTCGRRDVAGFARSDS